MSCPHLGDYQRGYRTFSPRVPSYAQGAYFPGDEPGFLCRLSSEICGDPDGSAPQECDGLEAANYHCPHCGGKVFKTPRGVFLCGNCSQSWRNNEELNDDIESQRELDDVYAD